MEKVAIIGAGLIGRAWAIVFARAGHPVKLWDSDLSAVPNALRLIEDAARELRNAGLIDEEPSSISHRLTPTATLAEAVRDADYVQENTAERLDVKREVYAQMDTIAKPACILASSTSTIPASAFSEGLAGRHRCIVAHPVNPPHVVPIVELCPAPWTGADVVARARALHEKVGQVPIVMNKEIQGFILNRLQAALLMEAWRLVGEGYVSAEDLDKTIKDGLGLRWSFMGPFETIDLNAPGGVRDYAARYGRVLYEQVAAVQHKPWDEPLVSKIEAERRKIMPQANHAQREAWRDRRLMALVAHKRAMAPRE
ncbi:MAG TPA: 3-hydroxyacyl-CoA dehydrogenase [Burkholderiales bacterium]|nr:3-hydroxyacyl-CoA dehydrogenase [Burkholderiales bacterium]